MAVFCFLLAVFWLWWFWATTPLCHANCKTQIFVIKKGESLGRIAQRLEEEKLVKSSVAFQILVVKEGLGRKIQAGDFRLSSGLKPEEIAKELIHGTLDRWVTLIEGLRREEIAAKLAEELGEAKFTQEEFLSLTSSLEGKLFPDTYLLPKDVNARRVVAILSHNFEKKTADFKLTRETLILASIAEREAKNDADRPIVAGILLKRLKNNWPLQTDATIQYAVGITGGWWPKKLTKEDLQIKSPYNTYLNRGLPPAPICNPGLASIKAAISPAKTDYWFYLSDKEGKMHYAKTLEEHQQNINRYLL